MYLARKPMTLYGQSYSAGSVVSMDGLSPKLRRQLVELRRVVPRDVEPAADVEPETIVELLIEDAVIAVAETVGVLTPQKQLTCGDYGGLTKLGARCGKNPENDGPCRWHKLN